MKHIFTLAALVFATACFGQEACQSDLDINANGAVDIADFLHVLGLFGDVDSDGDGVWDSQDLCTNTDACNYEASPTEPCQTLDVVGVCGGACETDLDEDGICDVHDCGQPFTYHGKAYETVQIGERCWFAENLRSENYENGDLIPAGLSDEEWSTTTSGAMAVYGEGSSSCNTDSPDGDACDPNWSLAEYGRLYNWYAVDDIRGLCPSGWSVPTDTEWSALTSQLGGPGFAGGEMKTTYGWSYNGNGTNSSSFSALPGGRRSITGSFGNAGTHAYWWSSSPYGPVAWYRKLVASYESIQRSDANRGYGYSIRCLKDSE